ncbi:hypothetical protein ATANTOWER_008322 [Ataeniobius toweri]|uniref:Uncharacterized protein n=1 Tax=Ataeniobius toweri TaxID=208326 RepID=A0ABU7CJE1_9TELE|nr:hypothetical protein [Ataeniobius toweri]
MAINSGQTKRSESETIIITVPVSGRWVALETEARGFMGSPAVAQRVSSCASLRSQHPTRSHSRQSNIQKTSAVKHCPAMHGRIGKP